MKKFFLFFVITLFLCGYSFASEPQIWTVNTRAEVLKGDARSVSIEANGTITLAPRLAELYKTGQQYIWSSAIDADGNVYLGTGGEGRIYKFSNGSGAMVADLNELNVSAIAIGKNGEMFAASSPDGKVYLVGAGGIPTVYFDPKEKYIWSLAVMSDGSLAVGTGDGGKIYRVQSANEGSVLFDSSETHIISLAADKAGNLYAGTDSGGLVLRFGADGKPFAMLDSPLREIHELAVGPDGSVYVLALGDSASVAKPPETAAGATPEGKTVSTEKPNPLQPEPPQKSRYDLTGAKTAVYRITPDGGNDILFSSTTVTGFSIYAHQTGRGVLLGTSEKGRIYNIGNDGRETLALQTDASQISTIIASGTNLYATSSNQGTLFKIGPDTTPEGTYESAVLDAKSTATWGSIWWRSAGNVRIETRSGNTDETNETWSAWSVSTNGKVASPRARFLQWRAVLRSSAQNASVSEVSVAYLARNIAPEVLSISILPPNVGLVANPPLQIDPNIELSGLDPQMFGLPVQAVPPRRVYLRGARAFQWSAEDRNGDRVVYEIFYKDVGNTGRNASVNERATTSTDRNASVNERASGRNASVNERAQDGYILLKANLTDTFYSLDGLSLADGRYTIKIVAKDTASNPVGTSLAGEGISEPFDIDNSQPVVTAVGQPSVAGSTARLTFSATDKWGRLARAEYSVNGGEWQPVYADDGISDSPEEKYTVEIALPAPGEYTVTLRVSDTAGNTGNARMSVRK